MTSEQLRDWRVAHQLTQAQLAAHLGVKILTIKRWEGGHHAPPEYLVLALQRLEQLLRAFAF